MIDAFHPAQDYVWVQSLLDAAMQLQQRAPAAGSGGNGDGAHMPLDEVGSLHKFRKLGSANMEDGQSTTQLVVPEGCYSLETGTCAAFHEWRF